MGKLSLARLMACAGYQRLHTDDEDYSRLGLCDPAECPDCAVGRGHYVKDNKVSLDLFRGGNF